MNTPQNSFKAALARREVQIGLWVALASPYSAEVCLIVQVETGKGLANLDEIAAVGGVDGVFIGPADLSAALGHRGNPAHPEVRSAMEDAVARIARAGKPSGTLFSEEAQVRHWL